MPTDPDVSATGPEKENRPASGKVKKLTAAQQKIADAAVAAATGRANAEIELLKGKHQHWMSRQIDSHCVKEQLGASNRARDEAREAARMAETQGPAQPENDPMVIIKPKGEAGDAKRGFNLREAMNLEGDENKVLYDAIHVCISLPPTQTLYLHICQRTIKRAALKAGIDFSADYRRQDAEQLAAVFKYVSIHIACAALLSHPMSGPQTSPLHDTQTLPS